MTLRYQGPIVDQSQEMPYEKVNEIMNPHSMHGRNYYMVSSRYLMQTYRTHVSKHALQGGTTLRSEAAAQVQKVFDRVVELSAKHPNPASGLNPFDIMVGYEYFPLTKVNTVASDAMAFRSRGPQTNVVLVAIWDEDEPDEDGTSYARGFARELKGIIESTEKRPPKENENDCYGNYGAFTLSFSALTMRITIYLSF